MNLASIRAFNLVSNSRLTPADSALLLLLAGILLLYAEFNRPGTILLGAGGALLFMLGVYKLLPLHFSVFFAGVAILGIAVQLFELRFPLRSLHAAGAAAGTLALILGLRNLIDSPSGAHWIVAIVTGAVFSAVTYTLGRIALLAARNKRLPTAPFIPLNLKPYPAASGKSGCTE